MVQKPTLMILGSHHLDNPGRDYVNFQADDVLSPKRQREIGQLVALLARFQLTKDERILLIISSGHAWLLQQFATESGYYQFESPIQYLE